MAITTNLVSYWPFDSNLNDAFGSDNGTGTGGLAYATSMSGFADAIDCAGTDYVSYGTPAYGTNSLTMSMWIKPSGIAGVYQSMWHNRTGSYVGWSIMVDGWGGGPGPNHYLSEVSSTGSSFSTIRSTSAAVAGSWVHFAVVVDRSTNTQRMYINGVLQSHGSDVASISGMGSFTNSTLFTGAHHSGGSGWKGEMDDAAWWTRALTQAEITAIHAAGAAGSPLSSFIPADADLMGQFSSVVHSVAAADADLSGQFASIVHSATAAARADLEGQFASIVHSVAAADADLSGQFVSVVHSDVPAPPSGGGGTSLQGGTLLQGIRMQSWGLQGEQDQGT